MLMKNTNNSISENKSEVVLIGYICLATVFLI